MSDNIKVGDVVWECTQTRSLMRVIIRQIAYAIEGPTINVYNEALNRSYHVPRVFIDEQDCLKAALERNLNDVKDLEKFSINYPHLAEETRPQIQRIRNCISDLKKRLG